MRHRIFCDNTNGNIGLMYTYWTNETQNKSGLRNSKKIYLHIINKDLTNLMDEDIEFPLNETPFYFDDNKIHVYNTVNGELEIKIYEIQCKN